MVRNAIQRQLTRAMLREAIPAVPIISRSGVYQYHIMRFRSRDVCQSLPSSRHFSSVQRGSNTEGQATRKAASVFLHNVQGGRVKKDLICQRVEELLLQLLKVSENISDGPLSLDLLNVALANANLPKERLVPRLFSLATQNMMNSGHPRALKEVHLQLCRLLDNHSNYLTEDVPYNSHHVNDACAQYINEVVLASNRTKQSLQYRDRGNINQLLIRLQKLYETPDVPVVANVDSCNAFIMFYCNQQSPQDAYKLLRWMVEESQDHPVELVPRLMSFTATIAAFAKIKPEKSMEIINWMPSTYRSKASLMPAPNVSCFNGLLDAWAKSARNDAGQKAEQTIDWMNQLKDTDGLHTTPDEVSYNCCINAWANSAVEEAPFRAEAILRKMVMLYEDGNEVVPTNVTFISTMNAWANSKAQDAPARVSALLDLMKSLSKQTSTLEINSFCYAVQIKAWEQVGENTNKRDRSKYANKILGVIRQMDDDGVTKTPVIHNAVITSLLKSSAVSAILYFLELEERYYKGEVKLNSRTFNSAFTALAGLNKPDQGERATDIFQRMSHHSRVDPSIRPDANTFNVLLKVWSRSPTKDAAEKADKLLDSMGSKKTSAASYVSVIIAWGRSPKEGKFSRVQDLLGRYKASLDSDVKISRASSVVYNAALSVCQHNATPDLYQQALETAIFTMVELRGLQHVLPDETTYVTLFRALARIKNVSGETLDTILEEELAKCFSDGLVSTKTLEPVYEISRHVFEKVFGTETTPQTATIPPNWSRRCKSKHFPPKYGRSST